MASEATKKGNITFCCARHRCHTPGMAATLSGILSISDITFYIHGNVMSTWVNNSESQTKIIDAVEKVTFNFHLMIRFPNVRNGWKSNSNWSTWNWLNTISQQSLSVQWWENLNKTFIKFESDGASLFTRFFSFTFHNSLIFLFLLNPPPHLDIAVLRRNSGLKLKLSFNDAVNNIASCLVSGLNN